MSGVRAVVSLSLALAGFAACQKEQPAARRSGPAASGPSPTAVRAAAAGAAARGPPAPSTAASPVSGGHRESAAPSAAAARPGTTARPCAWSRRCSCRGWRCPGRSTPLEVVVSDDGSAIAVLNRQPGAAGRPHVPARRDAARRPAVRPRCSRAGARRRPLPAHRARRQRRLRRDRCDSDLTGGVRASMVGSTATEQVRAAVTGRWVDRPADHRAFRQHDHRRGRSVDNGAGPRRGRPSPAGASTADRGAGGEILVAGGSGAVARPDGAGHRRETSSARAWTRRRSAPTSPPTRPPPSPFGGGLLMFDGNPPRLTQIGFDLSRIELGHNMRIEDVLSKRAARGALVLWAGPSASG